MTDLSPPRAVIFDWDNTLVDTWPIIHDALNKTLAEWGKPAWTLERVKLEVRHSMRDSFPAMFGEDWQEAGERYRQHYRASHLGKLEALPQARQILQRVKDKGLFSVVVSNKLGPSLREEVTHLGWNGFFDAVVGSDDAARDKPHADPVHLALDKSGIAPGPQVWFIGDSEVDLECAVATGCTAILYGTLARDHPEYNDTHYRGFPYHAHVYDHMQMLALLEKAFT